MTILLEMADKAVELTRCLRYVLNIGAAQGKLYNDPTLPLYEAHYRGLSVDALPNENETPRWPYLNQLLTPSRLPELNLTEYAVLKIDIDSYDGPVMSGLLELGHRPAIIQIEVHPEIPPQIAFSILENPLINGTGDFGFYGASLGWIAKKAEIFGYRPVILDFVSPNTHDVILVSGDWCQLDTLDLEEAWTKTRQNASRQFLDAGVDSASWQDRYGNDLLTAVDAGIRQSSIAKYGKIMPYDIHLNQVTVFG